MANEYQDELDFTYYAQESLYDIVDDPYFRDRDSYLIYHALKNNLKAIPFGDYLKRYIYQKAALTGNYREIPLKEYQQIIKDSFTENITPPSFSPTTAKLSALTKNWLTQQTVNRKAVFLLGFGLNMTARDVNEFLTKGLKESEINFKDPFEVICWYCYKNRYSYPKYEQLWDIYQATPANYLDLRLLYEDRTIDVRGRLHTIHDDAALLSYLSKLKTSENSARHSVTAKKHFHLLYSEAKQQIAEINSENDPESITPADIERIICSAIPTDRFGNLTPSKNSELNKVFMGKRFSRSRIHNILAETGEIDRFDLITLQFLIYALKTDTIPQPKKRYISFIDSINTILEECSMGKLYLPNPYESFILMCILSDDPMGTYADVWEMSFEK